MATIPGSVNTDLSTFGTTLPPVSPYQDQHRTNIDFRFSDGVAALTTYGFRYVAGSGETARNLHSMGSAVLATAKANTESALINTLCSIQSGDNLAFPNEVGLSSFAYELKLIGGIYKPVRIAFYDVSCIQWDFTLTNDTYNAIRFWMALPCEDVNDRGTVFTHSTIQWGFHPLFGTETS